MKFMSAYNASNNTTLTVGTLSNFRIVYYQGSSSSYYYLQSGNAGRNIYYVSPSTATSKTIIEVDEASIPSGKTPYFFKLDGLTNQSRARVINPIEVYRKNSKIYYKFDSIAAYIAIIYQYGSSSTSTSTAYYYDGIPINSAIDNPSWTPQFLQYYDDGTDNTKRIPRMMYHQNYDGNSSAIVYSGGAYKIFVWKLTPGNSYTLYTGYTGTKSRYMKCCATVPQIGTSLTSISATWANVGGTSSGERYCTFTVPADKPYVILSSYDASNNPRLYGYRNPGWYPVDNKELVSSAWSDIN